MNDDEIAARGAQAQREWTEIEAAFDRVADAIMSTLAETPVGQDTKVLKLHLSLQNLSAVRKAVFDVVDNGKIARAAISAQGLTSPH